jgi:hypothetical protein
VVVEMKGKKDEIILIIILREKRDSQHHSIGLAFVQKLMNCLMLPHIIRVKKSSKSFFRHKFSNQKISINKIEVSFR